MIFSLTGTPGTGKTTIAKHLQKKGIMIVDFHSYAVDHDCVIAYDAESDSDVIDIGRINEIICKESFSQDLICIEGHLSHLLYCAAAVIVLRCHPKELLQRLKQKQWSKEKMQENLEAEMLDIILCESIQYHTMNHTFEFDTTSLDPLECVQAITHLIDHGFTMESRFKPGLVDWSELITENLFEE